MLGRRSYDRLLRSDSGGAYGSMSFDPTMANLLSRTSSHGQDDLLSRFSSLSSRGSGDFGGSRDFFVPSTTPFLVESQLAATPSAVMRSEELLNDGRSERGDDELASAERSGRQGLDGTDSNPSCGGCVAPDSAFRGAGSSEPDHPVALFCKEEPTEFGGVQSETGGPLPFFGEESAVASRIENATNSTNIEGMQTPSFAALDCCSTMSSMENLLVQTGGGASMHLSGRRFCGEVPQMASAAGSSGSSVPNGSVEGYFSTGCQQVPVVAPVVSASQTVECSTPWQGSAGMALAPEQYGLLFQKQQVEGPADRQKWDQVTGQYQTGGGPGGEYLILRGPYQWSGEWVMRGQQGGGAEAADSSLSFEGNPPSFTSEPPTSGVAMESADVVTDGQFSGALSEAVSPTSSTSTNIGSVVRRTGLDGDGLTDYSSKLGGCTSLSPAVSVGVGTSPVSVHTPSGNTTAVNSGGITSEGSCNGSQAAPDETPGALTLPHVTSSSGSSEAGEMHSENEERSMEEGERCITELTRGNRCIRGAPRATVQQLYGQTYDLEALALEIDRTSLDAL
ncbi:hypothetical protein CSUI_007441, partial [Cystoisospora suis]